MAQVTHWSASSIPISGIDTLVSQRPPSHYDVLGVNERATTLQIRQAYRVLARRYHPDTQGGMASPEMATINAAWYVLSNAQRRTAYDQSRTSAPSRPTPTWSASSREGSSPSTPVGAISMTPARFPWRLVLWIAGVGSVAVVVLSLLAQPPVAPPIDNLLQSGSCVVVEPGEVAREVACDGEHDAVVRFVIPFGERCPLDAATLRDRQGMGLACVDRVEGA